MSLIIDRDIKWFKELTINPFKIPSFESLDRWRSELLWIYNIISSYKTRSWAHECVISVVKMEVIVPTTSECREFECASWQMDKSEIIYSIQ